MADVTSDQISLQYASVADAPAMLGVIRSAFSARPPIDPPAAALSDTIEDIQRALETGAGLLAFVGDELVGCLLISQHGGTIRLHRVSVLPTTQHLGVAGELIRGAAVLGLELGATRVEILARIEFPQLIAWWEGHGFVVTSEVPNGVLMSRDLPTLVEVPTAEAMHELGRRIASRLQPGDVLIATGDLGAGKTTLTQGIGQGLGVDGAVISPTFVLSRVHRNQNGPALVHVDAYRLGSAAELEDIDLEASLADSVTLIEWGAGIAEWLSPDRLEIEIQRSLDPSDETRQVYLTGYGARWANGALEGL